MENLRYRGVAPCLDQHSVACQHSFIAMRVFLILPAFVALSAMAAPDPKGIEFFEKHIRPVLVQRCYKCHSAKAKKLKANLRLDTRAGLRKGGSSGDAIIPGNAADSLLIQALRHAKDAPEMPPDKPLSPEVINAFIAWINMGAPDPRTGTPAKPAATAKLWSLRSLKKPALPKVKNTQWPRNPIDHFVLAWLEKEGLKPAPQFDHYTHNDVADDNENADDSTKITWELQ